MFNIIVIFSTILIKNMRIILRFIWETIFLSILDLITNPPLRFIRVFFKLRYKQRFLSFYVDLTIKINRQSVDF